MRTILMIRDSDLHTNVPMPPSFIERRASRAVVFDMDGKVGLLHATKKKFHKLPGGGINDGEGLEEALAREVKEELGCTITNIRELGQIEEWRNGEPLHQISYCYVVDVLEKGTPALEEDEIADGFESVWMNLDEAIATLKAEAPVKDYEGQFIQLRDLAFLETAAAAQS